MKKTLAKVNQELAKRYGSYASYPTEGDPDQIETYADGPAEAVDRLLDLFARPESQVLDIGCGAGFTLCRLAQKVGSIWGFEQSPDLLEAARMRVDALGLANATLVLGNVASPDDVSQLPDDGFDLAFSRLGPNLNASLMPKLRSDAYMVQELFQKPLGLLEAFGRTTFEADLGDNPKWLVEEYSWLGLMPVSIKEYYYESFFRDADHLSAYLASPLALFSWPMPPMLYDEERDRGGLELYVKYNTTTKGVRILNHRKVYLFRRARVQYAPAVPEVEQDI
jgi:SAM-dependent methyltransferase